MDTVTKSFLHAVDVQHGAVSSPFKPLELLSMLAALIWLRLNSSKGADSSGFSAGEQFAAYQSEPLVEQADSMALSGDMTVVSPVDISRTQAPGLEQALHRLSTLPEPYRDVIESFVDSLPLDAESEHAEALVVLDTIIEHYQQRYPRDIQTTPRLLADLMAALVEPKPGETIYDPCCGLGGLLLAGAQIAKQGDECMLHGVDIDPNACLLAAVRLTLSGAKLLSLRNQDALSRSTTNAQIDIAADIVLTTPPWGEYEQTTSDDFSISTISEALFSQHLVASLKPGGRGVIAVPDDFLSRKSYREIRAHLAEECTIQGVISLPIGVYLPWSNRKSSLLVVTKKNIGQAVPADISLRMMILPEHQWRRANVHTTRAETTRFISDTVQRFKKGKADRHLWERTVANVKKFSMNLEAVRNPGETLSELLHKIHRASLDVDIVPLRNIADVILGSAIDEAQIISTKTQTDHQHIGVLRITDIVIKEDGHSANNPELFLNESSFESIDHSSIIQEGDILLAISKNECQYVAISHFFDNGRKPKVIPDDNFIIIRPFVNDDDEYFAVNLNFCKTKEYREYINFCLENDIKKQMLCNEIFNFQFPSLNLDFIFDISRNNKSSFSKLFSIKNYLEFLLQSERQPVYLWLEKAEEVQNVLNYRNLDQDPIFLIDKAAEGFIRIQDEDSNIYDGFSFWKNHMHGIMQRLNNISAVPRGPVRYLLLDNAKERLSYLIYEMFAQFDFNSHPRLEMLSDLAAYLMEDLLTIIESEQKEMLDCYSCTFSVLPGYNYFAKNASIVLQIENDSILPFRNFHMKTKPDIGFCNIDYFYEKQDVKCSLSLESRKELRKLKKLFISVSWEGTKIDNNAMNGTTEIIVNESDNFGYSPIDIIFMYKSGYIVKSIEQVKDGTSYVNYHFRRALLGLDNDFSGKTKNEITEIMFKKTGRRNIHHISNLIRELRKSGLPIEVVCGQNNPFEVIYHDSALLHDIIKLQNNSDDNTSDEHPDKNAERVFVNPEPEVELGISPYIVGNPVVVEDMFFGRQDVIQSIQRQLSTEHKANVILLEGNRRTGKTSILKQLEKEDVLPEWVVVNCSFQAGEGTSGGLPTNEVFRLMAREIGLKVFRSGVQPWLPDQPAPDLTKRLEPQFIKALRSAFTTDYPAETFEMYLQAVIEAIKPRRLLLMLDEFDKLQEGIDAGVTSPSVPENIRYLLHTYDFTAILTGSRRIKRLREEFWSALFGLGHRIGISALELDDARELVTRPVEERLHYVDAARDRVVELCAGHPFLIQSLCTRIFDFSAKKYQRNITLDIVENAAREMISDNEHFRTLWGYAGSETRRFLLCLCARLQDDPDPLSVSFLLEKIGQEDIRMEHDTLSSDIDFLIELELLVRDATRRTAVYSIGIPLMTMWITTHIDHAEQRNRTIKEIRETS